MDVCIFCVKWNVSHAGVLDYIYTDYPMGEAFGNEKLFGFDFTTGKLAKEVHLDNLYMFRGSFGFKDFSNRMTFEIRLLQHWLRTDAALEEGRTEKLTSLRNVCRSVVRVCGRHHATVPLEIAYACSERILQGLDYEGEVFITTETWKPLCFSAMAQDAEARANIATIPEIICFLKVLEWNAHFGEVSVVRELATDIMIALLNAKAAVDGAPHERPAGERDG